MEGQFLALVPGSSFTGGPQRWGMGQLCLYYFFGSKDSVLIFINPVNSEVLKQKYFVLLVLRELEKKVEM